MERSKEKNQMRVLKTSLSGSRSVKELAEFWDAHDVTDYDDQTHDVRIDVDIKSSRHYVAVDSQLMRQVIEEAESRGISSQSLVNLWIKEKLISH
jgi:hypothetical protein